MADNRLSLRRMALAQRSPAPAAGSRCLRDNALDNTHRRQGSDHPAEDQSTGLDDLLEFIASPYTPTTCTMDCQHIEVHRSDVPTREIVGLLCAGWHDPL